MKEIKIPDVQTYKKDSRMPITKVYSKFLKLREKYWVREVLYHQLVDSRSGNKKFFPILAFRTRHKGDALWLISGIHGEEPAGVNAIAKNIRFLNRLARKIPIVLLPLCNPSGYRRDWRYPLRKRPLRYGPAPSVGSSEHYLIDLKKNLPRLKKPLNEESAAITSFVVKHSKKYKPLVVLDFHEDESSRNVYIYSQGKIGHYDPIARKIVSILKNNGFRFYEKGKTSFNEKIIKGVVSGIKDSSVDELLSAEKIIVNGQIRKGPDAKSVVVIETKTIDVPLKKRIKAHSSILRSAKSIYKMAKDIFDEG